MNVGWCDATLHHELVSTVVKGLFVGFGPTSALIKSFRSRLINKIFVKQTNGREHQAQRVFVLFEPTRLGFVQVEAQPKRAIIDANQPAVAEKTMFNGVYKFLVGKLKEFPFADFLNGFDERGREVDALVLLNVEAIAFAYPTENEAYDDQKQ